MIPTAIPTTVFVSFSVIETYKRIKRADYEEIPDLKEKGPKTQSSLDDPIENQLTYLAARKEFKIMMEVITKALDDQKNPLTLSRANVMYESIETAKKELNSSYFSFFSEDPLIAQLTKLRERISATLQNPTEAAIKPGYFRSYGATTAS